MKSRIGYAKYLPFIVLTLLLLIPLLSIGRPFRVDRLPDGGKNFSCGTCHINPGGGGARNLFGRDWEAIALPAGDRYIPAIANRDSDGDGFTNDEEFDAGTHPGDPESKPPDPKPRSVKPRGKLLTVWGKIKSGLMR